MPSKQGYNEKANFQTHDASKHMENARIARERVDLQTLSEPTLISSTSNLHLNPSLRTRSDEHSDEKLDRKSRFSTISYLGQGDDRHFTQVPQRSASIGEESENRPLQMHQNYSNQAFKSQQF